MAVVLAWRLPEAEIWFCATLWPQGSWRELRKCYFNLDLMLTSQNQRFSHTSGFLAALTKSEGLAAPGLSSSLGTRTGVK